MPLKGGKGRIAEWQGWAVSGTAGSGSEHANLSSLDDELGTTHAFAITPFHAGVGRHAFQQLGHAVTLLRCSGKSIRLGR